jgi:hypothetical protein
MEDFASGGLFWVSRQSPREVRHVLFVGVALRMGGVDVKLHPWAWTAGLHLLYTRRGGSIRGGQRSGIAGRPTLTTLGGCTGQKNDCPAISSQPGRRVCGVFGTSRLTQMFLYSHLRGKGQPTKPSGLGPEIEGLRGVSCPEGDVHQLGKVVGM